MIFTTLVLLTIATFSDGTMAFYADSPDSTVSKKDIVRYLCPLVCYEDRIRTTASQEIRPKKSQNQKVRTLLENSFVCKKYPKACRELGYWNTEI